MAILARTSALLALLPAFTGADAPAARDAPLEQPSGECTASSMRVELLQKSLGAPAVSLAAAPTLHVGTMNPHTLTKSTFALSRHHTGKSLAFKRFFFPVTTEEEFSGTERANFLELVEEAITKGAALPDWSEDSAKLFEVVAHEEDCGATARVRLRTVLGESDYATLSEFHFHGVFSDAGHGSVESREVGGLKVRDVERIFQEELGDLEEYSPWMDINVGIYDNDLDSYADRFLDHSVPVLALRWPSDDMEGSQLLHSLIVHAPDTQEVFEIVSTTAPSDTRLVVKDFPMTRHVFQQHELRLLVNSSGPTQLHISRSHYDLDAVKSHYEHFFQMEPIHEVRDAETGVGFVSFWHQSNASPDAEVDPIRVQVMYWNRPDQSMTVAHTTEWFERRLEQLNSQYMLSYKSCWPIWGDNHYTISKVSPEDFASVQQRYDDAGMGYMLFRKEDLLFTGYFPLPGGMYIEIQASAPYPPAPEGVRNWKPTNEEGEYSMYCWDFTCPP